MEFEGQNNDFGGTKRYNNIPLVPPNSCGPPTMVAVVVDFKDRVCIIFLLVGSNWSINLLWCISSNHFQEKFSMSKADYSASPRWKQIEMKKCAGLFWPPDCYSFQQWKTKTQNLLPISPRDDICCGRATVWLVIKSHCCLLCYLLYTAPQSMRHTLTLTAL